jgi:hypothetical protein
MNSTQVHFPDWEAKWKRVRKESGGATGIIRNGCHEGEVNMSMRPLGEWGQRGKEQEQVDVSRE